MPRDAELDRALQQLVEEQEAIHRVAELVARDATPDEVLDEVATQTSELLGVDFTALLRFEPDGATVIAALSGAPGGLEVGMRVPPDGDGATQRVLATGAPARMDDLAQASGHWPRVAHALGFASSAAAPITIAGRLWGVLVVSGRGGPLPPGVENDLTNFAKLAATAISGAQARRDLRALADEQAALRRVAELAARDAARAEVLAAVAAEASRLVEDEDVVLLRFAGPAACQVVAATAAQAPAGRTYPIEDGDLNALVRDTGRAARIDDWSRRPPSTLAREWSMLAAVGVPITVGSAIWGVLAATSRTRPLPAATERRLTQFADIAAAAIANAESRAQLTASRARVVATADDTRRRLQRDVHDGAQQRLVQTVISLKLALRALDGAQGPVAALVEESLRHAEDATTQLRDVVHGILPASLGRGGLPSGIESLVSDLPLAVEVEVTPQRLAADVETTAYFVVAEALTNVVKHARARRARVEVVIDPEAETVEIVVEDDGIGGAHAGRGSGLIGLSDRVAAKEGTIALTSPPGGGTTVRVVLPTSASTSA